ncbi:hypothetical protein FOC1_g10001885 [Fusarium oxysporum f. sp. cubense race 1]|uniref:Uncharacterized protein n=1 Tax=Fusarium oxysporum f. sp. cubense (strain race 1) TaxID=1229664 RepID=N4USH0_FUSC1|nr:hypothetical protein FOC1_g10001885 [Fusarium oxysporum f. sp. cubense race 1]
MSSRLLGTSKIVSITSSFESCDGLKIILPWAINAEKSMMQRNARFDNISTSRITESMILRASGRWAKDLLGCSS